MIVLSDLLQGYRGHRKHLKRLVAPKAWMLDKLGGVFVSTYTFKSQKTGFSP